MSPSDPDWPETSASPMLEKGEVHVWRIALEVPESTIERLEGLLSDDERARAERLKAPRGRERFLAGRGALREILGGYRGVEPGRVAFRYGPQGKPSLAEEGGPEFNLAHSGELALLAILEGRRVGVDIERARPMPDADRIVDRFFSPRECEAFRALGEDQKLGAFFRCWTRKEAYLKATGMGLSTPLDSFDVSLAPGAPPELLGVEGRPEEAGRWAMLDLDPGPGYLAAMMVEGGLDRLRCFGWPASRGPSPGSRPFQSHPPE